MDTSDILGQILSEESPDEIPDHYTEDSDPTQLVRRSSRIAARNPFSISEWPKEKILATLYSLNVQVPPNLNHDQLLTFLLEVNQDPQPPSTNVSSLPRSTGRKATEKRKNTSNDQASPTSKKGKTSNPPQASAQQGDDRVLTALLSIQGSLSDMDNRIQALESQRSASAPRATFDAQTSSSSSNCAFFPDLPRRSLGSALPAASTGVPFFPPAAAISPQLRAQILSGNDINLVKILLCAETNERRIVDCGDISVILKDNDPRLTKSLTMAEFNVAFGVFRDIICEVYPDRRKELDTYLAIISDLAMSYGGTLFYEYHKSFSSKAAMYIQLFNQ